HKTRRTTARHRSFYASPTPQAAAASLWQLPRHIQTVPPGIIAPLPESWLGPPAGLKRGQCHESICEDRRRARRAAAAKAGRFDQVSILLHWLTVLLVIEQLTTAWLLNQGYGFAPVLLTTHRSLGVLTAIVVFLRLLWRRRFAYLPPFP